MIFGDLATGSAAGWILDNNSTPANILTLDDASPTITVHALAAGEFAKITAVISGVDGLTKTGAGTLRLSTANAYSGGTSIDGGTLGIANDNHLGAVPASPETDNIHINNGGSLLLGDNNDVDLNVNRGIVLGAGMQNLVKWTRKTSQIRGVISGPGGLVYGDTTGPGGDGGGGGRLHLHAANTYTGGSVIVYQGVKDPGVFLHHPLALQNSTLVYETANTPSSASPEWNLLWFNGGNSSYTLGGLRGDKNLNLSPQGNTAHNLRIGNNNQDTTYTGIISTSNDADAGITKIGTGTLTLGGASTFTGSTTISNGTLRLGATGSVSLSPAVNIAAGGVLDATNKSTFVMPGSQTFTFGIGAAGAGSAGRIVAAGLDINNAVVSLDVTEPLDQRFYILAEYSSLSGTQFSILSGLPEDAFIDYAHNGNQIALVTKVGSPMMLKVY